MSEFQSYTVDEFAASERMSRSMVYKLWKQGKGPRFYMVGTVRRIGEILPPIGAGCSADAATRSGRVHVPECSAGRECG